MPDDRVDVTIPVSGDGDQTPTEDDGMPAEDRFAAAEHTAIVGMTQEYAASSARRINGSDFVMEAMRLGHDARRDRLNQADSFAYQVAREAGSGRTRIESNTPASTQTVGGQ
jgi:hypothetical protein